jgi:hypothetical protein
VVLQDPDAAAAAAAAAFANQDPTALICALHKPQ